MTHRAFEKSSLLPTRGLWLRSALALGMTLALAACSSGGKLPNADQEQELASFRLNEVRGDRTDSQEALSTSTRRRVLITFTSTVIDAATELGVGSNIPFDIYEGGTLVSQNRRTTSDNRLVWQKTFDFQDGELLTYQVFNFNIVARHPHSGTRTVRIGVNPSLTGSAAVIDLTDGSRSLPVPAVGQAPRLLADGTPAQDNRPGFFVQNVNVLSKIGVPASISEVTDKATQYDLVTSVCLHSERAGIPRIRPGQSFFVTGMGMTQGRLLETNPEGCLIVPGLINNFQYYSQQRWFEERIRICGRNSEVNDTCQDHVVYVNPWAEAGGLLFAGGQDLARAQRRPDPNTVNGTMSGADLQPPRIIINGYVLNFTGRTFRIDNDMNISSQRYYDFVLQPEIERMTFEGRRREVISRGKFRLDLLVLKTHGEAIGATPVPTDQLDQFRTELRCYDRETIFDMPADRAERADCYARAFLDHVSVEVTVENGRIFTNIPINLPDLRYAFSRNLLYVQLKPVESRNSGLSGIPAKTFAGTFFPLEDTSSRLLSDMIRGGFQIWDETINPTDPIRYDAEAIQRAITVDRNEEMSDETRRLLSTLVRNMPARDRSMATSQELDPEQNQARVRRDGSGRPMETFTPDMSNANSRQLVMKAAQDLLRTESIDEIMVMIRGARQNIRTNMQALTAPRSAADETLPPGVRAYKTVNRLKLPEELQARNFGQQQLQILRDAVRDRPLRQNRETSIDAALEARPQVIETLREACEVFFPVNDARDADREAQEFVQREWQNMREAYRAQRETLCRIQNLVMARIYDNVELDVTRLSSAGGCQEDTRPMCMNPSVTIQDNPASVNPIARGLNNLLGPSRARGGNNAPRGANSCPHQLNSRDTQILTAVLRGDQNLLQAAILSPWSGGVRSALDALAQEYFSVINLSNVRREVVNRQYPSLRINEILINPDTIDMTQEAYRRRFPNLILAHAKDRCKRDPLNYISLSSLDFVTQILGRPRNTRAGSTNITVSASIGLSYDESQSDSSGSARSNYVGTGAAVGSGAKANASLGLSFMGVGGQISQGADIDVKNAAYASQAWFIQQTRSRSQGRSSSAGEQTGRTLNAEEITFTFDANVLNCIAIRKKSGEGEGMMLCDRNTHRESVTETWYYVYLFFRNNMSALHDAAGSLLMRPWTAMIRGTELFDSFKEKIQNSASSLELRRAYLASPDRVMSGAFESYENYRQMRDFPGMIRARSIELFVRQGATPPPVDQ